jgi:hypothetical protein
MYKDIEEQIITTIEKVAEDLVKQGKRGDKSWTSAIMASLTELAYVKYNFWVCSTPNSYDDTINEWLYDMTWYDSHDEKGKDIKTIHLILESEWNWGFGELSYDFYKLLQGRAEHRVFIFQSKDIEDTMSKFEAIIEKSYISKNGDRFILAGWNDDVGFIFRLVIKR